MQYIVRKDHFPSYDHHIEIYPGDLLHTEERNTKYNGWLWVKNKMNQSGWVPEKFLDLLENGMAASKTHYSSLEVPVNAGDKIEILSALNGWIEIKKVTGEIGWIPEENVA